LFHLLENMRSELKLGASWYLETAARLILMSDRDVIEEVIRELSYLRKGMATLENVVKIVRIGLSEGRDHQELARKLLQYREKANLKFLEQAKNFRAKCLVTISYSNAVRNLLKEGKVDLLFIAESKPGEESISAMQEYSKFVRVNLIPDSTVSHFLDQCEGLVIGSDGVYSSGYVINKVGSKSAAFYASRQGKRVVVALESYKAWDGEVPGFFEIELNGVKVPLLEPLNLNYITEMITDLGVLMKPDGYVISQVHRYFVNSVLRY